MLKDLDLQSRRAFVDPTTGLLWALLPDGSREQVTFSSGVNPQYRNLINSSLMLYCVNALVGEGMGLLVDWAESSGNEAIVHAVTTYQANANLAKRCAIEGLENVAAQRKIG